MIVNPHRRDLKVIGQFQNQLMKIKVKKLDLYYPKTTLLQKYKSMKRHPNKNRHLVRRIYMRIKQFQL